LRSRLLILVLGLTPLFLMQGCAEQHMTLRLIDASPGVERFWPEPPEKPRYRYIGQLTGEENFTPENEKPRSTAMSIFEWLVGLVGGDAERVVLQRPQNGTTDAEGRIYVTDASRRAVFVFDKPGGVLRIWDMASKNSRFEAPAGIALGNAGEILVSDAELHAVFRLDREGNPSGEFGKNVLKRPTGLVRDAQSGLIYVADTYTHDIKVFDDSGRLIKQIGHRGEANGEFNYPTYLAFEGNQLYVTDTMNSRIQIFDAESNWLSKFGQRGLYVGNLVRPKGVAVDREGNIYMTESLYDRLLVFNSRGQPLLALGGTGKGAGEFYLPAGVWVDNQDHIYVADMFNGRVVVLQFLGGSL